GVTDAYLAWAVYAAVAVCGATTALQALRYRRIGSGHVLVMSSAAAFIWLCVEAIQRGGPALLATLVAVSALFQFLLSARIALFRRILTPTVSGTVLMLVPVTAMPVVFGMLTIAPDGSPAAGATSSAAVTVVVIVAIALKGAGATRLWAPVIGVVAGSLVAALFGLYDIDRVVGAPWVGLPDLEWPGLDLDFGPDFWSMIPAFLLVSLIVTLRSISSCVAIQSVSWRQERAVDFRAVQGGINAEGISNLLCGLAGTVPNTTYSVSVSLTELTGVAARGIGFATGAVFLLVAFLPKALAVVLAIPGPVVGGYLGVLMAMLFLVGIKVMLQDGLEYRKGLIVGISFWIGVGFQNGMIFPELVSELAGGLFANAMTTGGLAAIFMTVFVELTEARRSRMEAELDLASLPKIGEFLRAFATRSGWDSAMADRLEGVGEEALLSLVGPDAERERSARRLRLVACRRNGGAVLEFAVAPMGQNIQDRLALLGNPGDETSIEQEASLRLLRHLASSVRHHQYHDVDILTVQVKAPAQ
ncbi:MAG: purine/pyrimidine permease, partial [Rhodospirillaceae bacterium]|nr:purine/pyrimidine permease [Rhodospirillaceae bacterium]